MIIATLIIATPILVSYTLIFLNERRVNHVAVIERTDS